MLGEFELVGPDQDRVVFKGSVKLERVSLLSGSGGVGGTNGAGGTVKL